MKKTVAGTIRTRNKSTFFVRDVEGSLPLKLSYHHQLKYRFMDGDRITASLRTDKRGRLRLTPVEVISRALSTLGGVMAAEGNNLVFVPFARPNIERFKLAPEESENLREGDAVIARIIHYPSYNQPGYVAVDRRLGAFHDPGIDDQLIIHRFQLPRRFPRGSRILAKALAVPVCPTDLKKRTDFRHKPFITIDGDNAKDFDDAVAVDHIKDGGFRLYVSIADVSHYIQPGSILDQEAYRRGTSIYLPNRCIPMLPEELSNGICSLKPGKDRLTVTVIMEFDHTGRRIEEYFCPSVINCKARWTYSLAAGVLEKKIGIQSLPHACRKTVGELHKLEKLCRLLQQQRRHRGSINFDLPEATLSFDVQGNIAGISPTPHTIAHQLIEEFMLSANESVANQLAWLEAPLLYRIHPQPEIKKISPLLETLKYFNLSVKGWRSAHPKAFQELLHQAAKLPVAPVVNKMLLQIMQKACYSPVNCGHFGLALQHYTHFTSPIRRYPDLMVQRALKAHLWPENYKKIDLPIDKLVKNGEDLSSRERLAIEAERLALLVKKLFYLEKHKGENFRGFISGISEAGLFITLEHILADGLLPFRNLDDFYVIQDDRLHAVGEQKKKVYTIGEFLQVCLAEVDPVKCRLDLCLPKSPSSKNGKKTRAGRATGRVYRRRNMRR